MLSQPGGNEFWPNSSLGLQTAPHTQAAISDPRPEDRMVWQDRHWTLSQNSARRRGKVVVLTGNGVMSSCEGFLLMMRAKERRHGDTLLAAQETLATPLAAG